jgi:hypothetical protein
MKIKMGVNKFDEFDLNQRDRSPSNEIKSPASGHNHFNKERKNSNGLKTSSNNVLNYNHDNHEN